MIARTAATALDGFLASHPGGHERPIVLGVDLSLTSTGLAAVAFDSEGRVEVETDRIESRLKGHDRLEEILSRVVRAARAADLVVLEGLALSAYDTNRANAGLSWMLRHELWREGVPLGLVPPNVRILYALGKAAGGKDKVLAAVINRYSGLVTVDGNDVADAVVLAAMGCRRLGRSLEPTLPLKNQSALKGSVWPAGLEMTP